MLTKFEDAHKYPIMFAVTRCWARARTRTLALNVADVNPMSLCYEMLLTFSPRKMH